MPIDYARMKKSGPKLKAALTRALNKETDSERRDAVLIACRAAVKEWNEIGAWPDNWSRWQRALDDTMNRNIVACSPVRLENL